MDPPTTVSAAIHTIRIRQIWARIQSVMYSQTGHEPPSYPKMADGFRAELKEWLETAPKQLASNRAHNNAFSSEEWFQVMYSHSILLLHRYRLTSSHQSSGADPAPSSVYLECAHAAQTICSIYRQWYFSQRLNDTWGALHVLFLGGVTFLYCLWTCQEVRTAYRLDKVAATCMNCMVVLAVMAERWNAVEPYRDVFDMLSSATQSMLADRTLVAANPAMPFMTSYGHDQFTGYLSSMSEIGMCSSVEQLLTTMID